MKRLAIILICTFVALSAASQNKSFIAVSKTGDCTILDNGNWVPLKVGTRLTSKSVLRNSGQPEAEIQLVGMETGDSYKVFILHSQFSMNSLTDSPRADYRSGTASSYFRYVLQTALEANSDIHFVRNYTGMTHRGDSIVVSLDAERILYALTKGETFSFDLLKEAKSDYPVYAEVIPGGVILNNEADIALGFILFAVEDSEEGVILTPVFGDDAVLNVPGKTQRFKEVDIPVAARLLLVAYDTPLDPITVKRAFYNAEGAIPAEREAVKVGIFNKF